MINTKHSKVLEKVDAETKDLVIKLYTEQRNSKRNIAKLTGLSIYVITLILEKAGIEIRKHYANQFDEHYFDQINSPNKAYLLGFLFADGSISGNVCSIIVHEKDIEILDYFKKELGASNKISYIKHKVSGGFNYHVRLSLCSKHLCDALISHGCKRHKTTELSFPVLDQALLYHFVRGFMDGDGCICTVSRGERKYISLSFTGTEEMMQAIKFHLHVDNKITYYRNAYALHIGKEKDVLRCLKDIYRDCEMCLSRKRKKYMDFLKYKGVDYE